MEPGESAVTYEGHVPGMHNNWDHNSRLITGPEGLLGNRLGSEEAAHSSPPDECTRDLQPLHQRSVTSLTDVSPHVYLSHNVTTLSARDQTQAFQEEDRAAN